MRVHISHLASTEAVGEGHPSWHSSVSPSSGKMVAVGRSVEDVSPAAGMSVGEPSWGRTPVEEEEGRLDRGKSWTTVQSSWKPRPTLRSILKTTPCLRVDPSIGKRTGLFYPQTDQSVSVGSLTRGWHAVG